MFLFGVSYAVASISCALPLFTGAVVGHVPASEPRVEPRRVRRLLARHDPRAARPHREPRAWPARACCAGCARRCPHITRASGLLLLVAGAYLVHYGWYERRVRDGRPRAVHRRRHRHGLVRRHRDLGQRRRPHPPRAAPLARPAVRPHRHVRASGPATGSADCTHGPVRGAAGPRGRGGGPRAAVALRLPRVPRRQPRGGHRRRGRPRPPRRPGPRSTPCASPTGSAGTCPRSR